MIASARDTYTTSLYLVFFLDTILYTISFVVVEFLISTRNDNHKSHKTTYRYLVNSQCRNHKIAKFKLNCNSYLSLSFSPLISLFAISKIIRIYRRAEKYYIYINTAALIANKTFINLFIYFILFYFIMFLHSSLFCDSKFLRTSINNNIKTTRAFFYSQYNFQLHETTVKLDFQIKQQQI